MVKRPLSARWAAACALALAAALVPSLAASAEEPCSFSGVSRIVAVGDVHGAYDPFLSLLRAAALVDEKGHWVGGPAHLVQLGDVLDRGSEARRCLELLMRLQNEAPKAGGRVHALLGNHEVMNMLGDLRYVNPAEYAQYRTPQSEERRQSFYERTRARARERAKAKGEPFDERAFESQFAAQAPLGFVERAAEFSAEGRFGRWLRGLPVTVLVNGVAFVHGGFTPATAALGCAGINAEVRRELGEGLAATQSDPKAALATGENGPLWYRGLAREDESSGAEFEKTLQALGARAVVIGHTVTASGKVELRRGGRVVMIDAGMTAAYGGHAAALEIDAQGGMTAVYPDHREPLAAPGEPRAARAEGAAGSSALRSARSDPRFSSSPALR